MNYTLQRDAPATYSARPGGLPGPGVLWSGGRAESNGEEWKARGVFLRVFVYVFADLFAGFVWLLFYVGEHAPK
ncbi:hypothetical protein SMICM17S_03556 [Streptomyces microflavus]